MIELIAFIAGIAMLLFVGYAVFDVSNTSPTKRVSGTKSIFRRI